MTLVLALILLTFIETDSVYRSSDGQQVLRIGVVFTESDLITGVPKAYQAAVEVINERLGEDDGVGDENNGIRIEMTPIVAKGGSFRLSKVLCSSLETRGYHAIIGPSDETLSPVVRSVCNALDVPHISVHHMVDQTQSSRDQTEQSHKFSINVHPSMQNVHNAFRDFLLFANWTRVAILGPPSKASSLLHLHNVLVASGIECITRPITGRKLAVVLEEVKRDDFSTILADISTLHLAEFFSKCRDIGLSGEGWNFLIGNLDFYGDKRKSDGEYVDDNHVFGDEKPKEEEEEEEEEEEVDTLTKEQLKSFYFFRLLDFRSNPVSRQLAHLVAISSSNGGNWDDMTRIKWEDMIERNSLRWRRDEEPARGGKGYLYPSPTVSDKSMMHSLYNWTSPAWTPTTSPIVTLSQMQIKAAMVYDALLVLAETARSLNSNFFIEPPSMSCETEVPWEQGSTFYNFLNSVKVKGLTGRLSFKDSFRSDLDLELLRFSSVSGKVSKVGQWSNDNGLVTLNDSLVQENETDIITLTVVTKLEIPYVMLKKGKKGDEGNEAFEGFAIDLLKAISDVIGFRYKIYTVPDDLYGFYNHETGEWNGIVRQLIDKKADIAVGSMTINYARQTVIDFTKPFMNLGISILFKAPKDPATELFSFMNPLALEIWLYILFAYILVSLTIWIVARFSPYEWAQPHPCVDSDGLIFQNDFTLPNSFWFAIGTLMQQGSDLNPKAASTRIVGGIWWFFTLIIISSYTANLAAFLTVERMATPIESAEDLANQNSISYGTLVGGSTMTFFRDSKIETYQKMWRYMESNEPDTFVDSYEEGVKRVLKGNYAFLCESTMLDYLVQRNCNLTQIGGLLDNKGYGIATPKRSKWKDRISQAILFLQEKGIIQMYYDKWWKSHGHVKQAACTRKKTVDQKAMANALGIVNIGGIFVVLMCGLALAIIVAILEFCWGKTNGKYTGGASPSSQEEAPPSLCGELVDVLGPSVMLRSRNRENLEQEQAGKSDCSSCSLSRERYHF